MQRFPDVEALAAAPADEVLHLWSGLGYYSRARNLQRSAQQIVAAHGGELPADLESLCALPGIGRSTAAAILALSRGLRHAILDGNVKRVLTRFLAFDGDLAVAPHERELWARATDLLPPAHIEAYTQGLMDLGATVCLARVPQCLLCPVQAHCAARRTGTPERFPVKTRKLKRGLRNNAWLWLTWGDKLWLWQRPDSGVWAGLWSLPEFDSPQGLAQASADWPGLATVLPSFTHVLTHLDWTLHPLRWELPARSSKKRVAEITAVLPAGGWFTMQEALAMGLPAPVRKLLSSSANKRPT